MVGLKVAGKMSRILSALRKLEKGKQKSVLCYVISEWKNREKETKIAAPSSLSCLCGRAFHRGNEREEVRLWRKRTILLICVGRNHQSRGAERFRLRSGDLQPEDIAGLGRIRY